MLTFTLRCSTPGCGREDLVEALPTLADLHAVAGRIGWALGDDLLADGVVVAHDLCPSCAKRAVPADGGAPSTIQAEPVGHDSEGGPVGAAPSGTFPAPPPAAPAGGDPRSVVTFLTAAGATGIGPCDGRQPASFSREEEPRPAIVMLGWSDPWEQA